MYVCPSGSSSSATATVGPAQSAAWLRCSRSARYVCTASMAASTSLVPTPSTGACSPRNDHCACDCTALPEQGTGVAPGAQAPLPPALVALGGSWPCQ